MHRQYLPIVKVILKYKQNGLHVLVRTLQCNDRFFYMVKWAFVGTENPCGTYICCGSVYEDIVSNSDHSVCCWTWSLAETK